MISLSFGVSYSQLLLFSALNIYRNFNIIDKQVVTVKLILDEKDLVEYKNMKHLYPSKIFEPKVIDVNLKMNSCDNLAEAYGYYFILET